MKKYYYFLPFFDRPKINNVFSNTLKVRSCIANQIYNSKNNSLEKKKQNTGFVWNAASASGFRHYFYLLMISTKTKFTYTTNSSQFFLFVLPHSLSIIPAFCHILAHYTFYILLLPVGAVSSFQPIKQPEHYHQYTHR